MGIGERWSEGGSEGEREGGRRVSLARTELTVTIYSRVGIGGQGDGVKERGRERGKE